jgi:hypothetical protein
LTTATLKNCKTAAGSWTVISIEPGSTGVVIEDCKTIGLSAEGVRDRHRRGLSLFDQYHQVPMRLSCAESQLPTTLLMRELT